MELRDNITTIKGIGDKTAASFAKLGIHTVDDLIHTYPRNYLTYGALVDIKDAVIGERCAVCAIISSYVDVRQVRSLKLTNMTVKDSTGSLKLTWFNSPFLKNVFHKGETYVFVGTVKVKNNMRVMEMPEYYKLPVYESMRQEMQPVYPLTKGLSNKTFQKAIMSTREAIYRIEDYLDTDILRENGLMEITEAYENVHFPMNEEVLRNAIKRLAFDEFYKFLYDMNVLKKENIKQENIHKIVQVKAVAELVDMLPYKLNKGQAEAIEDILADMGSDNVMNRLIQGDVGSGKTIVAATSLYACVKEGYQGVLMVPTEVLAKQHFDELSKLFGKMGIKVAHLVGSLSMKEKRRVYEDTRNGEVDILIGTHAVIEDKVEFRDLGLVITDEQHRFGVNQRKKLAGKGVFPHVLVMSATPIPRTLAIIMYADLDISVISELPKGRKPIKNCVVGTNYRNTAYNFIASQVAEGSQVYVICPMVDESDTLDVTNVTEYTDTLRGALPLGVRVEMLHGQMSAVDKNRIMEEFLEGNIHVLVSTTVIEVGINNPNATVMMVENAERFGLAQLHQLRGRVGRGSKQSYCIFINGKESKESTERLQVLENSNDGFFIAGEDLKLRGPGDFFGIRQSGDVIFTLADIYNHADMLKLAQDILKKYGTRLVPPAIVGTCVTESATL
ncbi:MAG: ATP-dependent DNA helicase RecG [Lachnospiraceae bacterium]|nr:ATP-dependent DNA helicase RecG [Lachnospiraceae bacterium]